MDNNGDNMDGQADYGNEDYEGAPGDNQPDNNGEEVDQYFDDAGDVGYLPADHV